MADWLSEFLEQEPNPVDVFLDIAFDSDDSDDSLDIPETRADSDNEFRQADGAPIPNDTDSESDWAQSSDNASAFRPATPGKLHRWCSQSLVSLLFCLLPSQVALEFFLWL